MPRERKGSHKQKSPLGAFIDFFNLKSAFVVENVKDWSRLLI